MGQETKRALVVTSVASMVDQFLLPSIKLLLSLGFETTVCCNFEKGNTCDSSTLESLKATLHSIGANYVHIDFDRKVSKIHNHIRAYRQLRRIIIEKHYDIIHCHSPIGGLLTRIAVPSDSKNTKVIYTAHGFHFYKGASILNWLVYYPLEWILSKRTDILITINTEDYSFARKHLRTNRIEYIPGVGIDLSSPRLSNDEKERFKQRIGIKKNQLVFLSVGELNRNKNHITVLKALKLLSEKMPMLDWTYYICGQGPLLDQLENYTELQGMKDRIHFLGFTREVPYYLSAASLFIHPSYREGLSVALMEAIAADIPVICSDIRGNRDLVRQDGLFNPDIPEEIEERIEHIVFGGNTQEMIHWNINALEKCSLENVMNLLGKVYAGAEENTDNWEE